MTSERGQKVLDLISKKKKLFEQKNADYGEAYIKGAILLQGLLPEGVTLKTWEDHCSYQILTRRMDKLIRFVNLKFKNQRPQVNESIIDTLTDDAMYAFMLAELFMSGEENDSEN